MIARGVSSVIEIRRLRLFQLGDDQWHGLLNESLPPAGHAEVIRMHVGQDDLFDIVWRDAKQVQRGLPLRLRGRRVQAGINQGPAAFAAQQVTVDDIERVGERDLDLYDVVGDVDDTVIRSWPALRVGEQREVYH